MWGTVATVGLWEAVTAPNFSTPNTYLWVKTSFLLFSVSVNTENYRNRDASITKRRNISANSWRTYRSKPGGLECLVKAGRNAFLLLSQPSKAKFKVLKGQQIYECLRRGTQRKWSDKLHPLHTFLWDDCVAREALFTFIFQNFPLCFSVIFYCFCINLP